MHLALEVLLVERPRRSDDKLEMAMPGKPFLKKFVHLPPAVPRPPISLIGEKLI